MGIKVEEFKNIFDGSTVNMSPTKGAEALAKDIRKRCLCDRWKHEYALMLKEKECWDKGAVNRESNKAKLAAMGFCDAYRGREWMNCGRMTGYIDCEGSITLANVKISIEKVPALLELIKGTKED